jgi:fatty acid desaturase
MKLPHYRKAEWSFQRGAACTVDRPFLGWQGRFFLHDVAHYHVIHHFFPQMPFYHGEEATQYLKAFIGEHYASSDQNPFTALWDSYNNCQFVEDEGERSLSFDLSFSANDLLLRRCCLLPQ